MLAITVARAQFRATILHFGALSEYAYGVSGNIQVGNGAPRGAVLWRGTRNSEIDLVPAEYQSGQAYAAWGNYQVGYGIVPGTGDRHALLWSGSAESYVDLDPPGFLGSMARGVSGDTQVGTIGTLDGFWHAVLWHGTAASFVDLHPSWTGFYASNAYAVSGDKQVGTVTQTDTNIQHAVLWSGTAASAVDLHPVGFLNSFAYGVSGDMQVGYVSAENGTTHASVWHGTAASFVDINPSWASFSQAEAAAGNVQAGSAIRNGIYHALLWTGTAASAFDLHPFLSGLTSIRGLPFVHSFGWGVDSEGDVVGTADDEYNEYPILWTPIRTVVGTVNLQNLNAAARAGTNVTIEIRVPGSITAVDSHIVTLGSAGQFSFETAVPPGTYDLAAKASHWLRQRLSNQTLGIFGEVGVSFSLVNGDVNGDNVVSLGDFGQLRAAFGSSAGSGNWNPNADLNGDGSIGLADFAILRTNFGQHGDP